MPAFDVSNLAVSREKQLKNRAKIIHWDTGEVHWPCNWKTFFGRSDQPVGNQKWFYKAITKIICFSIRNTLMFLTTSQAHTSLPHGVGLTEKHRIHCRYNTFITNVERKSLQAKMIRKVYYLPWQIELVFKTWKSNLQINKLKRVKKERLECQLLARLPWALLNWRLLQYCNNHIQAKNKAVGCRWFTCSILNQRQENTCAF